MRSSDRSHQIDARRQRAALLFQTAQRRFRRLRVCAAQRDALCERQAVLRSSRSAGLTSDRTDESREADCADRSEVRPSSAAARISSSLAAAGGASLGASCGLSAGLSAVLSAVLSGDFSEGFSDDFSCDFS